jgi:hypothetical protein
MLCKRFRASSVSLLLALGAEYAHHLSPLRADRVLLSFAVGAAILGSRFPPQGFPILGYQSLTKQYQ